MARSIRGTIDGHLTEDRTDPMRSYPMPRHSPLILLLVLLLLASGCKLSESPVTGRKRAYAYSWEQEKQLGAQADQQIVAQYGVVQDDRITRYVERLGEDVLQESHFRAQARRDVFRETDFTFRVLDSPVVNAFALPGGYVYVTRGLLSHLNNEAQLAVVLGHEIGHVAARHSSQRALEQQLGQLGLITGAIVGQEVLGLPGQDILNLGSTATQLLFLRYGRDDERESDQLGVEYAAMSGYAASEGAEFFRSLERIQEAQGQALPSFLSTHPDPGEREQTIIQMAQEWQQQLGQPMNRVEQENYYAAIEGMVMGENPRNGFTRSNTFYHPELAFQFPVPQGYQVMNQAQQVVLLRGSAQQAEAITVFTLSQAASPQAAAREFAAQEGLQVLDQGAASSGNLPAYYALVDAQAQEGQTLRALAYFVEYNGQVYSFLAYAPQQQFGQYESEFQRIVRGFAPLTDRSILNIEPARLRIQQASRTAPFRTFVPEGDLPPDMDVQRLAILNQVELETTIEQGRPLKLPN